MIVIVANKTKWVSLWLI